MHSRHNPFIISTLLELAASKYKEQEDQHVCRARVDGRMIQF